MAKFPESYIRSDLVLSRAQVEQVDEELRSRWKLFCPASRDPRATGVFSKISDFAQKRLEAYNQERFRFGMSADEDLAFYDEIAGPEFGSWVCQARRSFILDTIVAADTYLKLFRPPRVIEVGTGLGFGVGVLARRHPAIEFWGIDRSAVSIKVAQNKISGLSNLRYFCSDLISFKNDEPFDLVLTLAGIPSIGNSGRDLLGAAANLLSPAGVLLGYSTHPLAGMRGDGDQTMGLVFKSMVAGFEHINSEGNAEWQCAPFEVFQRGSRDSSVCVGYDQNREEWPRFAKYVNSLVGDFERHTFSYAKTA